jgi:rhamnose utilization protein RhaD (predicted bifunctional aldolase and dehydrogenase)/NAD(P)-dependent dehydrogenase (short-subunit alcohol dehydrogenase family)
MQSLWQDHEAEPYLHDPLQARVYSSRLLGRNPDLVLHGGGNTSVKTHTTNIFGDTEEVLYVKGSGWDLASIEAPGFPAVRLDLLRRLAELGSLSDSDMVRLQKSAMLDPGAPNPSVEAILHAIIPFTFVDHTHADAVITISNTADGEQRIRTLYGERVLVVPYVMPGFILAKTVYNMTRNTDWSTLEGMVLLNHGIFSFGNDAKTSYQRMIKLVSQAEEYLQQQGAVIHNSPGDATDYREDLPALTRLRRAVSRQAGKAMVAMIDNNNAAVHFSNLANVVDCATRGPLTPDHVLRTKRIPLIVSNDVEQDVARYADDYHAYFKQHSSNQQNQGNLTCLDPAPRWAVWPGHGLLAFGQSVKDACIVRDIVDHTIKAIEQAEQLGGWQALPPADIFDVEYWELEQAKLAQGKSSPLLQGKVALVTGAASGIGRACVAELQSQGAAVIALDIDKRISELNEQADLLGLVCDVTDVSMVKGAVEAGVRRFGGLDILINNAGTFPSSCTLAEMNEELWRRSMDVNLTSHQTLLTTCIPYLQQGIDAAVIFIASKNVPAPGPGAAAYSVAKAGVTQLARVAALELAGDGIRVNVLHPDAVFDTGIWTPEILEKRARHYGMSVAEYKTKNLLKVEITSKDVARLACAMAGPLFGKTTGAQLPIDGGNERVI